MTQQELDLSQLSKEITDKFWALQTRLNDAVPQSNSITLEWNKFVSDKKINGLQLVIDGSKTSKVNCFSYVKEDAPWEFPFLVKLSGEFESVNFRNAKFEEELDCLGVIFKDKVNFEGTSFGKRANFIFAEFCKGSSFSGAKFEGDADFFETKFSDKNKFNKSEFLRDASFYCIDPIGSEAELLFDNSKLKNGAARFIQRKLDAARSSFKTISFVHSVADCPLVIDLGLRNCPDFSKSYFLKKFFIEETWLKEGERVDKKEKIRAGDEAKFRFLKKYFAEQGNHFKEQEYFSYEMKAKEKRLEENGGWEYFLFWCYGGFSDYGMSIGRPIVLMISSFVYSGFRFYYAGCGFGSALTNSFSRTLNPLTKFGCQERVDDWLLVFLTFQSAVNAGLLFLLFLGIRNKFKIK